MLPFNLNHILKKLYYSREQSFESGYFLHQKLGVLITRLGTGGVETLTTSVYPNRAHCVLLVRLNNGAMHGTKCLEVFCWTLVHSCVSTAESRTPALRLRVRHSPFGHCEPIKKHVEEERGSHASSPKHFVAIFSHSTFLRLVWSISKFAAKSLNLSLTSIYCHALKLQHSAGNVTLL